MTLVFKETKINFLVKGTKYMIKKYIGSYYTGTFTKYSHENIIAYINFDNVKLIYEQIETNINEIRFEYDHLRQYYCVVFQKKKYKTQWK
jgi:hypothetical protein